MERLWAARGHTVKRLVDMREEVAIDLVVEEKQLRADEEFAVNSGDTHGNGGVHDEHWVVGWE